MPRIISLFLEALQINAGRVDHSRTSVPL